ncbi:MAG: DevR family CRISPR-associated autoregulator [Chloroflexi bacterium]|nr:DevR family CRISPR-associated autoregulator [Chloroflexota bacterium]
MLNKSVYSISISARVVLNLHSLNNEGSEGNQVQTRMVEVIYYDPDGEIKRDSVNAISGDMLKHIQSEHLHRIAIERNLPMCQPCRQFDPNRIAADEDYLGTIEGQSNQFAIDELLRRCAITDLEGTLITKAGREKRSLPRKSVAEFAWMTGVPGAMASSSYFHVKFASEHGDSSSAVDESGTVAGKQTPFHRPTNSGVYALVCSFEPSRIGYNDISQEYAKNTDPSPIDRTARYKALLESVIYTFVQMNGAMRSAQMPHLTAFHGVIATSYGVAPAPSVSPLNPKFVTEIEQTKDAINGLHKKIGNTDQDVIAVRPFADIAQFAEILRDLIENTEPYAL